MADLHPSGAVDSACSNDERAEAAAAAAAQEEEEEEEEDGAAEPASASINESSDGTKRNPDDVLAKGIASVLGPVMNNFDCGVEGALKSQSILASSIDRLTRELDKLLEDVPLPFATEHATRISGVRKRVLSLNTSLRIIQRRMDMIQRLLAGYASKASAKGNQEKASSSFMEGSDSSSHDLPLVEVLPIEALSCSSADDHDNHGNQLPKVELSEMLDHSGNVQSGGSQEGDHAQENLVSKNYQNETSNQDGNENQIPNGLQSIERDQESGGLGVQGS